MAYRSGYVGGYADISTPPTASVYSYSNSGVASPGPDAQVYSYVNIGLRPSETPDGSAYSYSNDGLELKAGKAATSYTYAHGVLALATKDAGAYSYGAGVPVASRHGAAYSFVNTGLARLESPEAPGYSFGNTGALLAAAPSGATYSYEGVGYFVPQSRDGSGYSFSNIGMTSAAATPEASSYSSDHVGIGDFSASKDHTVYDYANSGFLVVPSPQGHYWQYFNAGFFVPDLYKGSAFWQYKNVGFIFEGTQKDWHGWGVPITSDPVEHDYWYWMYKSVEDEKLFSVPYGSTGWKYKIDTGFTPAMLALDYDDSSWSSGEGYLLASSLGAGFATPPQGSDGSSGLPYSDKGVGTITGGGSILIRRIIPAGTVTQAIIDCTGYMEAYSNGGTSGRSTGNRSVSGVPVPSNAATTPWALLGLSYAGNGNPAGLDIQVAGIKPV